MGIDRLNQVWVNNIAYIGKHEKPHYLSLIIDAYSKKITSLYISNTMYTNHMVKALKMAQKQRNINGALIHHSNRAVQYCSDEYQEYLKNMRLLILEQKTQTLMKMLLQNIQNKKQ